MIHRVLGRTGIRVSAISFGAGPVSGLMTGSDFDTQLATVTRAIETGINWFDTAPGYGQGRSESNLGRVLSELAADTIHIATKVRVPSESLDQIDDYVRRSVEESLLRLRVPRVTLLQLHNGITESRGDEPESITPRDVLGPVAEAFRRLEAEGLIRHCGLTGTGHPGAMREVIRSGLFDTLQVPFNILNPSAATNGVATPGETNYGNVIADCEAMQMGVFAIRVFAGGALLGRPPSSHTLRTLYFPLALYERDAERARLLRERVRDRCPLTDAAIRFVLSKPAVSSAIIGFGEPGHVEEIARIELDNPLPPELASFDPV